MYTILKLRIKKKKIYPGQHGIHNTYSDTCKVNRYNRSTIVYRL